MCYNLGDFLGQKEQQQLIYYQSPTGWTCRFLTAIATTMICFHIGIVYGPLPFHISVSGDNNDIKRIFVFVLATCLW